MIELRRLTEEDGPRVLMWRNMPEISRFMYSDHLISEAEHREWLTSVLASSDSRYWMIELDGEGVGVASVTRISDTHSSADWAFYLASPSVRGKGVGSVVEFKILEFVFDELELNRLACAVLAFNESVIAMHESFGFRREGILRSAIRKRDGWVDVVLLAQLRDEWNGNRNELRIMLESRGLL